jgi:outer membrane receptor protein involved in Fe transport
MKSRFTGRGLARVLAWAWLAVLPGIAAAGTTGKISGVVRDAKKQPLAGANVIVIGAPLGAATDDQGRFVIVNVPAGRYSVKSSMIGYRATTMTDVLVTADEATRLDIALADEAVELQEVVVSAKRPVVDVNLTSNRATVTKEEIAKLPVQELNDVVNLQAGVVDGHIRGGRSNEVQWQVDGVSVNNIYDNKSTLRIDRSLIEEVQVVSGTFDAEYGQAMSGVVNAVLKRGTNKFEWAGEAMSGTYVYPSSGRPQEYEFRPAQLQNYQASLSGPTGLPLTTFLISGRRGTTETSARATRYFTTSTAVDEANQTLANLGDAANLALGSNNEWSGIAKVTHRSPKNQELSYQAIFNDIQERRQDSYYIYDPDGQSRQHTQSLVHGFDWTHTLSKSTFYKLSLRQNWYEYHDRAYDDLYDPRYEVGPGREVVPGLLPYAVASTGVSFTRFLTKTNAFIANGSLTRQVNHDWLVKVGGDLQWADVTFGNDGYLRYSQIGGKETLVRVVEDTANALFAPATYHPVMGAAYVHNELEWNDMNIRAGLRLDVFDANSFIPSDLANPANAIAGAPPSTPQGTRLKASLAPRIGVSFPISDKAALFFAYAHLYQMPGLDQAFSNANYAALRDLQAASDQYTVMGNPDIKPQKTVTYQFGYKQALTDLLGVDVTTFYKDVRDLLGVEFISTYNDARYARYTNVDFGDVLGFTVSLDQRPIGPISATLDYTWQTAVGNSSDPQETATRAEAGEDPRPRLVPFDWDQRHTLNATITLAQPGAYNVSTIVHVASGQPYTPNSTSNFGTGQDTNSGRKPAGVVVDVRGEKNLFNGRNGLTLFGRMFNVFDVRYFNGAVFPTTGSPYYSRFPVTDARQLGDPTRYYGPRRIELGVTFNGGQR